MLKSNIRSFRYSDRVAGILEKQEGKSLNEKFENLVVTCDRQLATLQIQLKTIESTIDRKREILMRLEVAIREYESILHSLSVSRKYLEDVACRSKELYQCCR